MMGPLEVDPMLGDVIVKTLEAVHGCELDIILIVLPVPDDDGARPTFVSSLMPPDMKKLLISIAKQLPDAGNTNVTGIHVS
jgi:hypothetical protein